MRVTDGPLHWAQRAPDRPAIRCGPETVSYGQLAARVHAVARGLRPRLGGEEQRPVALLVQEGLDFLPAFLGAVQAGGIAVPLNPSWSDAERERALRLCRPAAVIADGPAPGDDGRWLSLTDLASTPGGPVSLECDSSGLFYLGFTSGSAGAPKAVARNHRAWVNSFLAMTLEFGIGPGEPVIVPGSLFFSFALIAALHALYVGGTVVLPQRGGVSGLLETLSRQPGTLYALPSLLAEALHRAGRRGARFPDLRRAICAGEKLHPETKRQVARVCPNAELYEYYGASELGYVTVLRPGEHEARPDSVGRPFVGSRVAVLDEAGRAVPPGHVGILCARTEYGFAGYYGQPELDGTVEHYGWHTVGDLARQDPDGYVYLVGRRDNMVVIRGENVYPEEVEQVLCAIPGVARAAVVPEPPDAPTHLVALLQTHGAPPDAGAVLQACRRALAPRKVPRRVVFVDELPTTPTGKLARTRLADLLRQAP